VKSTTRWLLLAFLLVLLAAFALRMWHLNTQPIWHDEGWSIRAMRDPFTTPDDNTPFLYYLSGHLLWRAGAGESPLAFRYVSVLIGLATVALALRLGWRWYGPLAGLSAGALVGSSPLLWVYAQEVRAYIAVPLFALLLIAAADAVLRHRPGQPIPRRLWLLIFVAQLAALYTHNLAVPLIVWLNVALGLAWLHRRDWRRVLTWAGIELALIAAYVPWLLTQSPSGTPLNTPPEPGLPLIRDIWAGYFLPALPQLENAQRLAAQGVDMLTPIMLYGALAVGLALVVALADRTRRGWLLLSHALLVPVFSTALLIAASIDFHPRYYIAAVPGTLLLLAGGMALALRAVPRNLRHIRQIAAGYTLLIFGGVLLAGYSLDDLTTTREYQHDDFAGLAEYYAALPADTVILIPFGAERALQDYYAHQLDIAAQFVNLPLYAGEESVIAALNELTADGPRRVEFLTWFQLPADPRGMYPCLLTAAHSADQPPVTRTYFGLMTQSYRIDALTFQPLDAAPNYREIALEDAAYAASPQGVCARTEWTLRQPTDHDASATASLLNPAGGTLARADALIARADNVGTGLWSLDDSGAAYTLLPLPAGAPPGEYTLTLNVYDDSRPSGFDLIDSAGNPAGVTYTLPQAIRAAGPLLPAADIPAAPMLQADNSDDGRIETGRPLEITLLLPGDDDPGERVITLEGDGWRREDRAPHDDRARLSWHVFSAPPGYEGEAVLAVDGHELARYTVIDVPRRFDPPAYDFAVDVAFPGVGRLAGGSVDSEDDVIHADDPPPVTLIWQAADATNRPLTVFVQLLAEDGRLLAQSDAQPAEGGRPTTGWIAGEYIADRHTLTFHAPDYRGPAYLIAGLYDPADGFRRVITADGHDHARLPLALEVTD
jgi:hypothetical protein